MCQKSPFPPNLPLEAGAHSGKENPGEPGAAPGILGNEEMPLDARIEIPGAVFQRFSAPFPFIGGGKGRGLS